MGNIAIGFLSILRCFWEGISTKAILLTSIVYYKWLGKDLCIVRLSDILKSENGKGWAMPELCSMAVRNNRCNGCFAVAQRLEQVMSKLEGELYPFVFCCNMGAKVLLVPEQTKWKGEAYLAFCRSPIPHKNLLKMTAEACNNNENYVKELWQKLPQFGSVFAKWALAEIRHKWGKKISDPLKQTTMRIGAAYGLYEFDIVIYDTLRSISSMQSKYDGVVNIKFASKAHVEGVQIVRLVTDTIGAKNDSNEIPIIGLVTEEENTTSLEEFLNSPRLTQLSSEILSKYRVNFPEPHPLHEEGVKWRAETVVYLKERLAENNKWLNDVKYRLRTGIECGSGSVCAQLLKELGGGDLKKFKEMLLDHANCLEESLGADEFDKQERIYVRILTDLREAIKSMDLENLDNPKRTKHVIEELLNYLEPFLLKELGLRRREGETSNKFLATDLLENKRDYMAVTDELFYESNASETQQIMLGIFVDFMAVMCKAITLGIMSSYPVIEYFRRKAYRKYAAGLCQKA